MQSWIANYRGIAFTALAVVLLVVATVGLMPFLPALLWATVLSVLTYPIYRRLKDRFGKAKWMREGWAENGGALVVTLLTLVVICIPFVLIGIGLFLQIGGMTSRIDGNGLSFEGVLQQVDQAIRPIAQRVGAADFRLTEYVNEHKEELTQMLRQPVQRFAGQAGFTILTLVFAMLTQFFMLRDGHRLLGPAQELLPFSDERTVAMVQRVGATIRAVFIGTVLVAILQGTVIGITYGLVGVPNALLLGVVSAILCIIPLLGAPVIYIPVGILLLTQGQTTQALIVLGVGFLVVSQIDNLIKPFLIGGQINLHPMAIFFAILGGVLLIGPIGVMAGPMLLTILLAMQDALREALKANASAPVPESAGAGQ